MEDSTNVDEDTSIYLCSTTRDICRGPTRDKLRLAHYVNLEDSLSKSIGNKLN